MIDDRPLSADRVPTLTEVVELDLPSTRPGRVDDGEHADTSGEAATAEAAPAPNPGEAAALDAPGPSQDPVGAAEPHAMAEDFVLAGLDEEEVADAAPADIGRGDLDPAAEMAPSAIEPPLPEDGQAAGEDAPAEVPAQLLTVTADAAGPQASRESSAPQADDPSQSAPEAAPAPQPEPAPVSEAPPTVDVDAVVGRVLSELTPRIDMLLESRLREALAPALAAAADGLIRDTRASLAVAVRELVQEAVDRALQRRADH